MKPTLHNTYVRILAFLLFAGIFVGAIFLAQVLGRDPGVQAAVANAGYVGVVVTAIIGGLNVVIPIPPASFTPLFVASGLSLPFIVLALAIGTLIADFIGYALGHVSRVTIEDRYPKVYAYFSRYSESTPLLVYPLVLLYAAFVPFPNEAILIPLAVAGFRFSALLIPLLIGNLIHQVTLVYGITFFFGAG